MNQNQLQALLQELILNVAQLMKILQITNKKYRDQTIQVPELEEYDEDHKQIKNNVQELHILAQNQNEGKQQEEQHNLEKNNIQQQLYQQQNEEEKKLNELQQQEQNLLDKQIIELQQQQENIQEKLLNECLQQEENIQQKQFNELNLVETFLKQDQQQQEVSNQDEDGQNQKVSNQQQQQNQQQSNQLLQINNNDFQQDQFSQNINSLEVQFYSEQESQSQLDFSLNLIIEKQAHTQEKKRLKKVTSSESLSSSNISEQSPDLQKQFFEILFQQQKSQSQALEILFERLYENNRQNWQTNLQKNTATQKTNQKSQKLKSLIVNALAPEQRNKIEYYLEKSKQIKISVFGEQQKEFIKCKLCSCKYKRQQHLVSHWKKKHQNEYQKIFNPKHS